MANYIVSDTNLTAVANAIRTKGGTSAPLEFPDEFVSAIGDIQTGGGSSVTVEALSVTQNGTYTAPTGTAYSPVTVNVSGGTDTLSALENDTLTSWTSTANAIKAYLFSGNTNLESASYPNATRIGTYAFNECSHLTSINVPNVTLVNTYSFYGCSNLAHISFSPNFNEGLKSYIFGKCVSLSEFDARYCTVIPNNTFNGASTLSVLILRKTDGVCTLAGINAFNGTPFASGNAGGTLYVPQDLIESYQSANNWKTILGYPNNQIKKIEGSIYE